MNNSKNAVVLLRGIPGSGKSTLAEVLSDNGRFPVYSVDDFFTDENGKYEFDHLKNYLAYEQCRNNTEQAMFANTEKIFVHNAFTIDWEMEPYFELAKKFNYTIFVITVENYHGNKNTHDITDEQIEKMKIKYKIRL